MVASHLPPDQQRRLLSMGLIEYRDLLTDEQLRDLEEWKQAEMQQIAMEHFIEHFPKLVKDAIGW